VRILFFAPLYYPHLGGVENHVAQVSNIFLKKKFNISVVTEKDKENEKDYEIVCGIEVFRINLFKKNKFLKKFVIWKWLKEHKGLIKNADIIHCHDTFVWYLPFRFLYPNKKTYSTFHGWEGKFPIPKRYVFARKIWEKLSHGNICVGDYLKKWYGTEPTFITYGAANLLDVKNLKINLRLISYIGRLDKDVGIVTYLSAIKYLISEKIIFNLDFYGEGSFVSKVKLLGNLRGSIVDVWDKAKSSNIIMCSSYLSLIESLQIKKFVIAVYENKLKRDYLLMSPFASLVFTTNNPEDISKKIIKCIDKSKQERKMVERGYRWAREQTWEKVADLYLKLWGIKTEEGINCKNP